MFIRHGDAIFNGIRQRQPDVANDWAISTVCQLITAKGERLAHHFKPEQKKPVSEILKQFSMADFLSQAEVLAPSTCQLLRRIAFSMSSIAERGQKQELVCILIILFICLVTIILGSRNDNLYARKGTERPCY